MSSSQASSGHGDPDDEAPQNHTQNGWLEWLERNHGGADDEENEEDEEDEEDDDEYTGELEMRSDLLTYPTRC